MNQRHKQKTQSQVTPVHGRQKAENHKLQASTAFIERPSSGKTRAEDVAQR